MPEVTKPEDVPPKVELINAPDLFINGAQVLWAGNDPILVLHKIMPGAQTPGTSQGLALVAPVALVRMSSAALKEMAEVLRQAVELREKDLGHPIETLAMRVAQP
jgi:hypothetical protein